MQNLKIVNSFKPKALKNIINLEYMIDLKNGLESLDEEKVYLFFQSLVSNVIISESDNIKIKKLIIYWIDFILDNNYFSDNETIMSLIYQLIKITDTYPLLINFNNNFYKGFDFLNSLIIQIRTKNEKILNNIQLDIYSAILNNNNIVFSAPTSYGKTTIVLDSLKVLLTSNKINRVIFILPNKSLINEYRRKLRNYVSDVPIYENPYFKDDFENIILLFTQERFLIYNSINKKQSFDYAVIDEAQILYSLNDDRSILLAKSISILNDKDVPLIFLLPYISEAYNNLINYFANFGNIFISNKNLLSFVSNNYYLLSVFNNELRKIDYTRDCGIVSPIIYNIGAKCIKPLNINDWAKIIVNNYSEFVKEDEKSIFFVTSKQGTKDVASVIRDNLVIKINDEKTPRFKALINYIKKNIHPEFEYIDYLNHGIAIHFSDIDPFIKRQVEFLFNKSNDLKLIVCTSTLVRGVNLNCKNMFILYNKKLGMSEIELKNLLGRTARLSINTQGNVYTISFEGDDLDKRAKKLYTSNEEINTNLNKNIKEIKKNNNFDRKRLKTLLMDANVNSNIKSYFDKQEQSIIDNHDYFLSKNEIEIINEKIKNLDHEHCEYLLKNITNYKCVCELSEILCDVYEWKTSDDFIVRYRLSSIKYISTVVSKLIRGESIFKLVDDLVNENKKENKNSKLIVCMGKYGNLYVTQVSNVEEHINTNYVEDFDADKHLNLLIYSCLYETQKIVEYYYKKYLQDFYYRLRKLNSNDINEVELFLDYTTLDPKKIYLSKIGLVDQFAINELASSKYDNYFIDGCISDDNIKLIYDSLEDDDPFKYSIEDIIKK